MDKTVRRGFDMRLAAIVVATCFLWGAAATHVREMIAHTNFNPGNAGAIFWTDIFVPIIGIVLLYHQSASTRHGEGSRSYKSGAHNSTGSP
jgi:hypothetical protein